MPYDILRKRHWDRNEQIRRASNDAAVVLDAFAFPRTTLAGWILFVPSPIADLYAMLAILSVVRKLVEETKTAEE